MKISVIVVTRNRAQKLKRLLVSLEGQSQQPDQVVVVDNNSDDHTKSVVIDFENKLPINYVLEQRRGIPYARNTGWANAQNEILAYIDDDCVADSDWVKNIVMFFKRYGDLAVLLGQSKLLNPEYIIARVSYKIHERWFSKFINKNSGLVHNLRCLDTKNLALKREILVLNKLCFNKTYHQYFCGEDTDFGMQLQKLGVKAKYCSKMNVFHEEVDNLKGFLNQAFRRGRATYRIRQVWPSFLADVTVPKLTRWQKWIEDWSVFKDNGFLNHFIAFFLFKLYSSYSSKGRKYESKQYRT
jgi:glycosyltransferase involved in cell wall biosynthesis